MLTATLKTLIILCGIGHIGLSAASVLIPRMLHWKKELASLQPLMRQMFWTYAGYILVINFCFGVISVWGAAELMDHSFLARCITLFIGVYWLARVLIQFFYFDTSQAPKSWFYTAGEVALVLLFAAFTLVYLAAFSYNMSWI